MTLRILIADKLAPEGGRFLESQEGVSVSTQVGLAGEELARALAPHDGVVVRSAAKITRPVLESCVREAGCRLRAIARAGVGVDNIDLEAATRHGIAVMNAASASTITTAEHAFALLIALARNIGPAHRVMAEGGWDRSRFVGHQLHGRTLGVVGLGRIGRTVADRALAFGIRVLAHDPFVNAPSALDGRVPLLRSFDQLIEQVDAVSFHVPRTDATTAMLGREQLARARPGLLVVNAARGGIVDESALLEALDEGRCGGAAMDVFEQEPPPSDHPLRGHPRVLCTPHLGASTIEAQEAVAVDACRSLLRYLMGEGLDGAVNVGGLDLSMNDRQRRFVELSRRMIGLLHAASGVTGLQRVRFTVRGEALAARADTLARYALASLLHHHLEEPVNIINATLIADQRGIDSETVIGRDHGEDRLAIEVDCDGPGHRVEGVIYEDGVPRITNLDGYTLDMVPAGHLVLLTNVDEPGRIGLVGKAFGDAQVNIAEMVIGRRQRPEGAGRVAMMIIKLDAAPGPELLRSLEATPGILSLASVDL
jgi:D-3-phosphoglycerate dehydrogenase